jgi:hypothetical protein
VALKPNLTERYRAANVAAARIIAADPERYPGFMQEWAQVVLKKESSYDERSDSKPKGSD